MWMAVALCLLAGKVPARAGELAEAKALLGKSIKALGDKEKLARLPAATLKTKGTIQVKGMTAEFSGEWSAQAQEKYRWEIDASFNGQAVSVALILNKDKGWARHGGNQSQEIPPDAHALAHTDFAAVRLAERLVTLEDKAYHLSPLGELKINDRTAVGIKVAHEGGPDIDLFFDKETMLPLRTELRVKEGKDGQEVLHSFSYGDYKEVDGVKHFTKLTFRRDDKVLIEMELSDIKLQEKLDDGVFDKP
jgi:hypothetical protein